MDKKVSFAELELEQEIPPLVKQPTTRQLAMWAGAQWAFDEFHYDKDFAINYGLPGVIVQGGLKAAFLGQLLTDWLGEDGWLKKFRCSYRKFDCPGDVMTCRGKIVKKYMENGENLIDLEVWIENQKGETTTPGLATVVLHSVTKTSS